MAVSQFRTAVSFRLSSLHRGPVVCERKARFGFSATAGSLSSIRQNTLSKEVCRPWLLFARGLTTSTGTPARSASLSWPRATRLQPNGNRSVWKLGPTTSTGSFHAFRSSAFSTEAARKKDGLRGRDARMVLQLDTREVEVPLVWLRDHCRCSKCYQNVTGQKIVESYTLDKDLAVSESKLDGDTLSITWQDGHCSEYSLKWLDQNFHRHTSRVERGLWDAARWTQQRMPMTKYEDHMNTDEGLRNTLSNILKYGFCFVEGAPDTADGTGETAARIGLLMNTVFATAVETIDSAVWSLDDMAYTSMAVGPHTDNTYFFAPGGLQVFQLLYHDGDGGKTVLVDGFNQAEKVRKANESHFRSLTSIPIPHEFKEPSRCNYNFVDTVLTKDNRTGDMIRIRYNTLDRTLLSTIAPDDVTAYYDGYEALARNINEEGSKLWLKLKPGNVLFVDNWRVMHGRSSYTGRRVLTSCFVSRDDWTSRARLLGLL